jgi:hypothetical protein
MLLAAERGDETTSSKELMMDLFLQRSTASAQVDLQAAALRTTAAPARPTPAGDECSCVLAKHAFVEAEKEASKAQKLASAVSKEFANRTQDVKAQRMAAMQAMRAANALSKAISARKMVCASTRKVPSVFVRWPFSECCP